MYVLKGMCSLVPLAIFALTCMCFYYVPGCIHVDRSVVTGVRVGSHVFAGVPTWMCSG